MAVQLLKDGMALKEGMGVGARDVPIFAGVCVYLHSTVGSHSGLTFRFHKGIFLGIIDRTNEFIVGIEIGAIRAKAVLRGVEFWRCDLQFFFAFRREPWKPHVNADGCGKGHIPIVVNLEAPPRLVIGDMPFVPSIVNDLRSADVSNCRNTSTRSDVLVALLQLQGEERRHIQRHVGNALSVRC